MFRRFILLLIIDKIGGGRDGRALAIIRERREAPAIVT